MNENEDFNENILYDLTKGDIELLLSIYNFETIFFTTSNLKKELGKSEAAIQYFLRKLKKKELLGEITDYRSRRYYLTEKGKSTCRLLEKEKDKLF